MKLNIDFDKLSKKKLSEDELMARKILNICAAYTRIKATTFTNILPDLKARHLILARELLYSNSEELKSMAKFEYLVENLLNTSPSENEEEDEIYV